MRIENGSRRPAIGMGDISRQRRPQQARCVRVPTGQLRRPPAHHILQHAVNRNGGTAAGWNALDETPTLQRRQRMAGGVHRWVKLNAVEMPNRDTVRRQNREEFEQPLGGQVEARQGVLPERPDGDIASRRVELGETSQHLGRAVAIRQLVPHQVDRNRQKPDSLGQRGELLIVDRQIRDAPAQQLEGSLWVENIDDQRFRGQCFAQLAIPGGDHQLPIPLPGEQVGERHLGLSVVDNQQKRAPTTTLERFPNPSKEPLGRFVVLKRRHSQPFGDLCQIGDQPWRLVGHDEPHPIDELVFQQLVGVFHRQFGLSHSPAAGQGVPHNRGALSLGRFGQLPQQIPAAGEVGEAWGQRPDDVCRRRRWIRDDTSWLADRIKRPASQPRQQPADTGGGNGRNRHPVDRPFGRRHVPLSPPIQHRPHQEAIARSLLAIDDGAGLLPRTEVALAAVGTQLFGGPGRHVLGRGHADDEVAVSASGGTVHGPVDRLVGMTLVDLGGESVVVQQVGHGKGLFGPRRAFPCLVCIGDHDGRLGGGGTGCADLPCPLARVNRHDDTRTPCSFRPMTGPVSSCGPPQRSGRRRRRSRPLPHRPTAGSAP